MATLEDAISLAVEKHRGQVDKSGQPYILHPMHVMCGMKTEHEMMAAILHDVVEDTDVSLQNLEEWGYPVEVVAAVDCLSRREGESYEDFVARTKSNALAVQVKLGDLRDNMDIRRIKDFSEDDLNRLKRYQWAWHELTASRSY
jgi:(p)ppGpp synthase/HD superfamily hydrolase